MSDFAASAGTCACVDPACRTEGCAIYRRANEEKIAVTDLDPNSIRDMKIVNGWEEPVDRLEAEMQSLCAEVSSLRAELDSLRSQVLGAARERG